MPWRTHGLPPEVLDGVTAASAVRNAADPPRGPSSSTSPARWSTKVRTSEITSPGTSMRDARPETERRAAATQHDRPRSGPYAPGLPAAPDDRRDPPAGRRGGRHDRTPPWRIRQRSRSTTASSLRRLYELPRPRARTAATLRTSDSDQLLPAGRCSPAGRTAGRCSAGWPKLWELSFCKLLQRLWCERCDQERSREVQAVCIVRLVMKQGDEPKCYCRYECDHAHQSHRRRMPLIVS